jgi:uncharacterized protein (TIGR02001 family)
MKGIPMRNLLLSSLFAGTMLASAPAWADDAPAPAPDFTITGGADVASQYRFRGISQSDNRPVFQGTFTITHKSGFYLSTWGSSASSNNAINIGGTEIDVYAGYSKTIGGFTIDGGLYGYIYPGSAKAVGLSENYFEVYGDVSKSYGPVTAKVGVNWAPKQDYFKDWNTATKYNVYVYGELGLTVPNFPVTFHSHVGHTAGGFDYFFGDKPKQYIDFTAGATYKWKALSFDVSVVGTNLSKKDVTTTFVDEEEGTSTFFNKDAHRAAKTAVVGTIGVSF